MCSCTSRQGGLKLILIGGNYNKYLKVFPKHTKPNPILNRLGIRFGLPAPPQLLSTTAPPASR